MREGTYETSNEELLDLLSNFPGGAASYKIEGGRLVPICFSDGVPALSGHSREELWEIIKTDAFCMVDAADKERVTAAFQSVLRDGGILDVSYRVRRRDGNLTWIRLNGRCMGPVGDGTVFYAVYTGIRPETRLFRSIADEMVNGIYVIGKQTYDILYISEKVKLFPGKNAAIGQKCYAALHGKDAPCGFCTLNNHEPDGMEHEMVVPGTSRFYNTRFHEMDWNGIPAYVKYVQDTTDDVIDRRDRHRLEEYFETVVKNLPGGIAVIRYEKEGTMSPEYMSGGFSEMLKMTAHDAWNLYKEDVTAGVHPDDRDRVRREMSGFIQSGESQYKAVYRLKRGDGTYIWVNNILSAIQNEGGVHRVYAGYQDITDEHEQQDRLQRQYNEQIIEHYHAGGPDALIAGNCNITQDRIVEMRDCTNSGLLETFGSRRDDFFSGVAGLIVDEREQQAFRDTYLNEPALEAYRRGETEKIQTSFVKLPGDAIGRYLQFRVNMIEVPDTNDITGVLTIADITEETISSRILQHLSVVSYDLIEDVDLEHDSYKILAGVDDEAFGEMQGCHSKRIARMLNEKVLPKDKARVAKMLDTAYMLDRLRNRGPYSFPYSIIGKNGGISAKNLTVSVSDMRLGRICLARTDITESIQEQQRLLNIIAYTFEILAFVDIEADQLTLYTRQTVLENLPPYIVKDYSSSPDPLLGIYFPEGQKDAIEKCFRTETLLGRLEESPGGYDFVVPYESGGRVQYKQINVLWGDKRHTICMVCADVTDMIAAERKANETLEKALVLAEEASRAKSDFLSSMSHDIRTPMNAITGMTMLAMAHLDEKERVESYLKKIVLSSKHLLSLINDILDMNKIERSKITLGRGRISVTELADQLSDMVVMQAAESGVEFHLHMGEITHWYFYGDTLRINQILINILGNAVKFTRDGGTVDFTIREIKAEKGVSYARYLFQVSDTGMGMSEEFMANMFEPFTRDRNVAKVEGSGLGLSIASGLVKLMGGVITVSSCLDQGTTFRIELECEAAQEEAHPAMDGDGGAADEKGLGGRCFLLAEDNEINAEILDELLQMYGARTVVKTDGIETVSEFGAADPGTYDAILMDIQMPLMDGYEAARQIRALDREDAKRIPIIAMTANAFEEDIREALMAGMNAHISKPIDIRLVWNVLGKLLKEADTDG